MEDTKSGERVRFYFSRYFIFQRVRAFPLQILFASLAAYAFAGLPSGEGTPFF
jgi:hypothetical protein